MDPHPGAAAGEIGRRLAEAQPQEVRLAARYIPPRGKQRLPDPGPLGDRLVYLGEQLILGLEGRKRRRLGHGAQGVGQAGLAELRGNERVADQVADPEPGQPVRLGEGAQHGQVGPFPAEAQPAVRARMAHVLRVCLVDEHQAVRRDQIKEVPQLGLAECGAGWVIGVTDDDDARVPGDSGRHRGQVKRLVQQRNADTAHSGEIGEDRVKLEGAPGVEHLGARLGDGLQCHLQQGHRPRAQRDPLLGHAVGTRDLGDELAGTEVRIAIDRACRRHDSRGDVRQHPVR